MNSYRYLNREEDIGITNSWDAFVDYLETTYFPGASELLDSKLIAHEYEAFRNCYST